MSLDVYLIQFSFFKVFMMQLMLIMFKGDLKEKQHHRSSIILYNRHVVHLIVFFLFFTPNPHGCFFFKRANLSLTQLKLSIQFNFQH